MMITPKWSPSGREWRSIWRPNIIMRWRCVRRALDTVCGSKSPAERCKFAPFGSSLPARSFRPQKRRRVPVVQLMGASLAPVREGRELRLCQVSGAQIEHKSGGRRRWTAAKWRPVLSRQVAANELSAAPINRPASQTSWRALKWR